MGILADSAPGATPVVPADTILPSPDSLYTVAQAATFAAQTAFDRAIASREQAKMLGFPDDNRAAFGFADDMAVHLARKARDAAERAEDEARIDAEEAAAHAAHEAHMDAVDAETDRRIAARKAAATSPLEGADPYKRLTDRTDTGNANLLILLAGGNLRYVHETRQWLRWDGQRWQCDEHETFVTGFAHEVARHYLQEAKRLKEMGNVPGNGDKLAASDDCVKWAAKARSKSAIDAMITLARKIEGVPISVTDLDRKPHLLGVDNGVVDLRTGELRESEAREDFVTKRCPVRYKPHAKAPRWDSLIVQVTGAPIAPERDETTGAITPGTVGRFAPRPALARYIHAALGYGTTGETREQKFFFGIGEGSNGKGIIFDTIKSILGPYAVTLPADALMATRHGADAERPTALAASLAGARFVVASESKEGQKLDVATIKAHTGDAEMTARKMRENPFTFRITHKIWLLTNARPAIDHIDTAIKGRLHFVPFDRRWNRPGEFERDATLPDGDKGLMAQLAGEREGILASLVRGAVAYYTDGLTPPAEVVEKTREYVMEQDQLGRWMATLQRCLPKLGTMAADLLTMFIGWCAGEGCVSAEPHHNKTAFGRALGSRGIGKVHTNQGDKWGLKGTPPTGMDGEPIVIPPPPATMPRPEL
ncbi:MAG TPA: phage/plasmid primase, P4 family [Steroidobacteraceae bacterium]